MSKITVLWTITPNFEVPSGVYLRDKIEIPSDKWVEAHKLTTMYLEELQSLTSRTNLEEKDL